MSIFDIRKFSREINLSNRFCTKVERNFNAEFEHYKREFESIGAEYLKIFNSVKQQFGILTALEKIYVERENSQENFSASNHLIDLSRGVGTEKIIVDGGATMVAKGIGVGVGVGAGVAGLMTAFGTAGTGAAISGLTGAAKVSALLAALGGGTIASGGAGIIGGIAVLGAAVAVPALIVTGLLAHDKIKSEHRKALKRRKEAERLQADSKIFFANLEKGARQLREINYEFHRSADFFRQMMTLSMISPELGCDEDYQKILHDAAQVTENFGSLKVLDAENKLNSNLDAEISVAKKSLERCNENYISFRVKISPQVLELTERVKNSEFTPLKDEEIRAAFDEAINAAQEELDITAMKLNKFTESYIPQFRSLLKRGVTLKIFYGIGEENANTKENCKTKETVAKLKAEFSNYPNFHMRRTDTHTKIFICDDKFFVLSSYNVLSKDGELYTFGEAGIRSNNAEMIVHHKKEYFNF